jgi:hypothetical protein
MWVLCVYIVSRKINAQTNFSLPACFVCTHNLENPVIDRQQNPSPNARFFSHCFLCLLQILEFRCSLNTEQKKAHPYRSTIWKEWKGSCHHTLYNFSSCNHILTRWLFKVLQNLLHMRLTWTKTYCTHTKNLFELYSTLSPMKSTCLLFVYMDYAFKPKFMKLYWRILSIVSHELNQSASSDLPCTSFSAPLLRTWSRICLP